MQEWVWLAGSFALNIRNQHGIIDVKWKPRLAFCCFFHGKSVANSIATLLFCLLYTQGTSEQMRFGVLR